MTDALWSSAEAATATDGQIRGAWQASGLSIDSRSIAEGDLFIALEGPNHDGHDYAAQALKDGAAAAMVHRVPEGLAEDAPLLVVEDTLKGLQDLGRAARARTRARIVGVTGSSGKTSTKEALRACLETLGRTYASVGSFNNHWGLPLSLARMPRNTEFGIFEMGMNHPGEIAALTAIARPEVAIVTNIGLAHIEFFEDQGGIADAKAEIFSGMGPQAVAVLPRDDAFFDRLAARAAEHKVKRVISYGRGEDCDVQLLDASLYSSCSAVSARVGPQDLDYCLALPGMHWVINSLGVLAVVKALGGDVVTAAGAFARLTALPGRGQRHRIALPGSDLPGGGFELIDESYNANPASMRATIAVLGRTKLGEGGRRIAALGDMREMGPEAPRHHAELAPVLEEAGIDLVFACGESMAHLYDALPERLRGGHAASSKELAPMVAGAVREGDAVAVKGSLASGMKTVVEALLALDSDNGGDLPRAANGN